MKLIYQAIKHLLNTVTDLREIAWFADQYAQTGDDAMSIEAAAYIEFEPITWMQTGKFGQEAIIGFLVHVVSEEIGQDTDKRIESHLSLVDDVYKAIQGRGVKASDILIPPPQSDYVIINTIVRKSTTLNHDLANLAATIMRFEAKVQDLSAMPATQTVLATPVLSTSYQ